MNVVRKSAIISECGTFRYVLRREWDDTLPPYISLMLNPSTANAEIDDPTIVRNMRRAEMEGCGSLIVGNAGAGRATDPKVWKAMPDPIGPENDAYICRILGECKERNGLAVVGWGIHGDFLNCGRRVAGLAKTMQVELHCLGVTKSGQPRHPLYISYDLHPIEWLSGTVYPVPGP